MVPIRNIEKLRNVIFQCFHDSIFIWHSIEIFDQNKRLYRTAPFEKWYDIFIIRFKKRTFLVSIKMQVARFSIADTKTGNFFKIYVQEVTRFVKTTNFISVHNQLVMAWNNFEWEFRRNTFEFIVDITFQQFLENLDAKMDIWHEMARHR